MRGKEVNGEEMLGNKDELSLKLGCYEGQVTTSVDIYGSIL
jgi:hypothetical protein